MNKLKLTLLCGTFALTAMALEARTILKDAPASVQAKVDEVEAQGYTVKEWRRTLLGRYQVEFVDANGAEREVVMSSADGSVMRDEVSSPSTDSQKSKSKNRSSNDRDDNDDDHGTIGDDSDDDHDDNDHEDDDDDDNSDDHDED